MQIDLRTVTIEPQRQAFDHLVRRFGDKPASRYQEGSYDIQATENLHYRPTWDPQQELYDKAITQIVMKDWYDLKDPRQFFYNTYTLTRARQQEAAESNFRFIETHGLANVVSPALREKALAVLVPLRHVAWGANQNNTYICGYGYGTVFTQPCIYQAMDHLGIAQYLSRIGLAFGGTEALAAGKKAWIDAPAWQGLRRYIEDCLVTRDPFELFVAQNVALDGLLYPLVYGDMVDSGWAAEGGSGLALATQFMADWFDETRKWIDAVMKVAAAESAANRDTLTAWAGTWGARAAEVLLPVARLGLGEQAEEVMAERRAELAARLAKSGIKI
ncbi:aromatic/alkene monooxygenase hydroxylase subunit beta [Zavarzinia aquatilis]|uniref:Phenol hydroxylase n=1 Tax=Zavarzinia aquatilis TaxID=2211142 RepID=A0A317E072_9PROT|nr:aromatic/alkene monooxygenase hydroxylase subunit beta [Zavarzinia aquatilis]PWR19526.1 phenol hydroxylase [Zavarzinia aquatilis]